MATFVSRPTGWDRETRTRWRIGGTDLGIPYLLENGSVGYLFGDTFYSAFPDDRPNEGLEWRSPVALRSSVDPKSNAITFDSAYGTLGDTAAPEIMYNQHNKNGTWSPLTEFTVIPNDAVSFQETGRQIMSFMSINRWGNYNGSGYAGDWRTSFAGLAYSDDGNTFTRWGGQPGDAIWFNNAENTDPYQMQSIQRDGDYVYMISTRAGRQNGPMMLQRVPWEEMFYKDSYEGWGWNGTSWGWGRPCTSIFPEKKYGEPSLRKLGNKWVMSYVDYSRTIMGGLVSQPALVTRTADAIDGIWSAEKVQVTANQLPNLYGGFIHPYSTTATNGLTLMLSRWSRDAFGNSVAYHVEQWRGTV